MHRVGRKESFPRDTDPRKTYKYRALKGFSENIEKWGFDEATTKLMITAVVNYGKRNKLLTKGAMILNMKSVLEICIKELERRGDEELSVVESVKRCHDLLNDDDLTTSRSLLAPVRAGGMSKLASLLISGKMPIQYLAVSKIAWVALQKIDRDQFPNNRELRKLRARFLYDNELRDRLEAILGNDLNMAGLVGNTTCII